MQNLNCRVRPKPASVALCVFPPWPSVLKTIPSTQRATERYRNLKSAHNNYTFPVNNSHKIAQTTYTLTSIEAISSSTSSPIITKTKA